jgi:hypothetical protein
MAGATFPATRPSMDDVRAQGSWLESQRGRFQELDRRARPGGQGARARAGGCSPAVRWGTHPSGTDPVDVAELQGRPTSASIGCSPTTLAGKPLSFPSGPSCQGNDAGSQDQEAEQLARLVEPTGPASSRFTEAVEGRRLGLLRPLEPLAAWLLRRQAAADLRRLKHLLEAPALSGSGPEETAT